MNQLEPRITDQEDGKNDLQVIFSLLFDNWYLFVVTVIIAVVVARFLIGHTMAVFQTSATILITETEDRPSSDNFALLQGLGLSGGMRNLENQIMILKSRQLTETTLKDLPFEIEYYTKTLRNKLPFYPEAPVKIVFDYGSPLPKNTEFSIYYLGNNRFSFDSESTNFPIHNTASFGDTIKISGGSFRVLSNDDEWFNANREKKLYFIYYSTDILIKNYSNRINVQRVSKDGSILKILMIGTNPKMDADFLNIHIQKYQNISLDKKNTEANRRIQFIDDQLIGLSDSLLTTETKLQQFRSANRVMDLSVQGQAIIAQLTRLENDKAQLSLEANYYDYLAEYLERSSVGEMPMVPITMGITDPGLTRLVEELTDLQGQFSTTGAGEKNPLQRNLDLRVQSARESLKETLNGLRRANSLARSENQQQINRANSQASSLPVTERQLLGIERKFKLNDELYTFLLEARAEQHMKKASNRADSEIIDPADVRFSSRISPNPPKIYLAGILIAFMLAFAIIFLKSLFSNKIKHDDIKKMTEIPVIGRISHNDLKTNTVVFDDPDSAKAEAFRLLRSRMQFITKDATSPVILVTSSAPEDGKTYISINLASAYSLLGKKTIIIGFDLRKPKIFQDFNLNNDKGVSTYLIGQDDLEKVIIKTSYENLSVIPGGPIPPNPSELIALEKTKLLLNSLKERYDFIIVDTPPLGIVSDTFHLASLADACLIVVRPGHTLKKMFATTLNEIKNSRMNSLGLIINDLHRENKQYGYSEKYSYKSGKKRTLRNILTKRNI